MIVQLPIVGIFLLRFCLGSPWPQQAYPLSFNNSTRNTIATASGGRVAGSLSSPNASQPQGHCCFVVQDTFNVNYWANQYTSTFYGLRRITSIVTFKTQYQDTIITRYATSTTIKNSTYVTTYQNAEDGVYASNGLVGPKLAETLINGTITTFHSTAIASPTGFFAYPSVKIINVPGVKNAGGQLACATSSIYTTCLDPKHFVTFEGVNSAAEAYFGTLQQSQITTSYLKTFSTWFSMVSLDSGSYSQKTFSGLTTSLISYEYQDSYTAHNTSYSTVEIRFSSPFLYFPTRGSTERTIDKGELPGIGAVSTPRVAGRAVQSRDVQDFDSDKAVYGYVPSELIRWILQNTDYVAQYPSLGSCIPGGPSLLPLPSIPGRQDILTASDGSNYCEYAAPAVANAVPDLTTSSEVMVQSTGCFHPGNCPSKQTPAAEPASTISSDFPRNTAPSSTENESHRETSTETEIKTQSSRVSKVGSNPSPAVPSPVIVPITSSPVQSLSKPVKTPEQTATQIPANSDKSTGPVQTPNEHHPRSSVSGSRLLVAPEAKSNPQSSNELLAGSTLVKASSLPTKTISRGLTPIATVGDHGISASDGVVIVAGSTVSPGGPAIILASNPVSRDRSGNLVVASTRIPIPPSSPDNVFTDAGQVFTVGTPGVVVAGETVSPNAPAIIVSGTPISLGSSQLVIGSSTIRLPESSPSTTSSNVVIAGQTFAQLSDGISVAGTTLRSNGPALTISGIPISLDSSGIVIGASTFSLPTVRPGTPLQTLTIDGQAFTVKSDGVAVASTMLRPNGPALTISGTPISLGNSEVVIGTSTFPLPTAFPDSPSQTFTLNGQTFTAGSGAVAVAGNTLTPHGPAVTISGTPISVDISGIVIGSSTFPLPTPLAPSAPQTFTLDGQTFTAGPNGVAIAGNTLGFHGPGLTVSGTPISLGPSGIIIGSSTYPLPTPFSPISAQTFTLDGQTITVESGGVAIAGTTLVPHGPGLTISGTPISLGPSVIIIGSSTFPLPTPLSPTSAQTFTIAGQTFTATPGGLAIAGSTLSPNGPEITISGIPLSLATSKIIIDSSTYALPLAIPTILPSPSIVTFNGETLTLAPSAIVVGGHTLSAGQATTISGVEISLGTAGPVVGGTTLALSATTQGLGEVIVGGLGAHGTDTASGPRASDASGSGGGGNGTSTAPLGAFTGDAKRLVGGWWGRGGLGGMFGMFWGGVLVDWVMG